MNPHSSSSRPHELWSTLMRFLSVCTGHSYLARFLSVSFCLQTRVVVVVCEPIWWWQALAGIPYYLQKRTPFHGQTINAGLRCPENNEVTLYGIAPARLTSISAFYLVKFIVAQVGARRGYAVPTILEKAGMLERFYTDITGDIWSWQRLFCSRRVALSANPRAGWPQGVCRSTFVQRQRVSRCQPGSRFT